MSGIKQVELLQHYTLACPKSRFLSKTGNTQVNRNHQLQYSESVIEPSGVVKRRNG